MELTSLDLIFPFVFMGYLCFFFSVCVAFVTFLRWIRRGSSGTVVLRLLFWIHEAAVSQGTSPPPCREGGLSGQGSLSHPSLPLQSCVTTPAGLPWLQTQPQVPCCLCPM